ncbi:uncharacterized protein [Panulirus ornatus]|uniref:uncharacterized protein n=1 Tax=Panulirus ornatus TaxID=150431 RepID=UPI003A898AF3
MDGTAPLTLWALVNKLDQKNEEETEEDNGKKRLISLTIWPHWKAREVQVALLEALGHTDPSSSTQRIVKLRDAHGALIPLTPTTLKSTPVEPLLLEICTINGPEGDLPMLPPSLRSSVQAITARLEKRLALVEAGMAGLEGRRAALLEAELRRIQDVLNFMSRKLDHTRAPAWVTGGQT